MINRISRLFVLIGLVTVASTVALGAAQEQENKKPAAVVAASEPATPAAVEPAEEQSEAKSLIDAMAAIGSIIAGAEKTEESTTAAAPATGSAVSKPETTIADAAKNEQPAVVKKPRSAKNSVALITGGAAAGAALGAAMGKGGKGAMYGAALGGVAGLIYDRMTYKNPGKI